ncbi:hypothetical protein K450DRAFT_262824 [Umbelopsis ramanniana AG]|uniref:Uncharacterized protein n=1 Tax=Umbelopsis ramanniana AG TaxID=1314678 RepID=A0AAD5HAK3_UMBRA|nr:uncharacterized protein K450DRAFT_262824 [Umbelopsis ramanniana AG]KAI8575223.1 hypothetical protein K450DRAFT_262824 [Umbelopsis ramanniana AG]
MMAPLFGYRHIFPHNFSLRHRRASGKQLVRNNISLSCSSCLQCNIPAFSFFLSFHFISINSFHFLLYLSIYTT